MKPISKPEGLIYIKKCAQELGIEPIDIFRNIINTDLTIYLFSTNITKFKYKNRESLIEAYNIARVAIPEHYKTARHLNTINSNKLSNTTTGYYPLSPRSYLNVYTDKLLEISFEMKYDESFHSSKPVTNLSGNPLTYDDSPSCLELYWVEFSQVNIEDLFIEKRAIQTLSQQFIHNDDTLTKGEKTSYKIHQAAFIKLYNLINDGKISEVLNDKNEINKSALYELIEKQCSSLFKNSNTSQANIKAKLNDTLNIYNN
jgi:hypothetical protein